MDLHLKNKVVVVSGGAGEKGAVGETIVRRSIEEGVIPAFIDQNADRGNAMVAEFAKDGHDAHFVQADLTVPAECRRAIDSILGKYQRIDAVINNLGVNDNIGLDKSYEEFIHSIRLNLAHIFLLVKHSAEALRKSRGSILNIGSKVAVTGQGNTSGYAAAKGGLLALTREWAVEFAKDGVRSNALVISECWTPGYDSWAKTQTDPKALVEAVKNRVPLEQRMTTPDEVANTALFLISDRASHITGQHIYVDGGYRHLDRAYGVIG